MSQEGKTSELYIEYLKLENDLFTMLNKIRPIEGMKLKEVREEGEKVQKEDEESEPSRAEGVEEYTYV